jgi:tocopherol cyclase
MLQNMSLRTTLGDVPQRLVHGFRRTGADVPFGDPLPSHSTEMEGWFWRVTEPSTGRAIVALCSVNQHPEGDWSTTAVALHPGGIVRAAALDGAVATHPPFNVAAGSGASRFSAGADGVDFQLDDVHLQMEFSEPFVWPKAFGGGGVFSSIPFLNQYWHPYRLGGLASGSVEFEGQRWDFTDATLYAERNWGAGFPQRWWWGQAHDFDGADVSVAFSGGLLELGPLNREVTGVVVRLGRKVIRLTPPMPVRSVIGASYWNIRGRSPRYQIELEGDGAGLAPHVLPVPLPAERRNGDTDFEHLGGRLRLTVKEAGRVIFSGTSELAGLEIGSRPA